MNTPASAVPPVPSREAVDVLVTSLRNEPLIHHAIKAADMLLALLAEVERLTASLDVQVKKTDLLLEAEDTLRATIAYQETLMEGDAKTIDDLCEQVGKLRDTVADQAAALAERDKDAERYRKARTMGLRPDALSIVPIRPDKFDSMIDAALAASVSSASEDKP